MVVYIYLAIFAHGIDDNFFPLAYSSVWVNKWLIIVVKIAKYINRGNFVQLSVTHSLRQYYLSVGIIVYYVYIQVLCKSQTFVSCITFA
jgi:hypothetical protein